MKSTFWLFVVIKVVFGARNVIFQTDPRTGLIFEVPLPATYITPVKALATFYNSSVPGFQTGNIQGSVAFFQANFPNNQAVVIDTQLDFPSFMANKLFAIEILLNGDLDSEYCKRGMRMADPMTFKMHPNETSYVGARKRNDISIINASESIIGRTLRIVCPKCEGDQKVLGCAVIGRVDDEIYIEKDPNFMPPQVHDSFMQNNVRSNSIINRKSRRKLLVLA
uniref:Secreted protein n=1 Tax=Rhabditophanes sp. KR3021 TaxID=114890 RepID=A0AC35UEB5_9BILA